MMSIRKPRRLGRIKNPQANLRTSHPGLPQRLFDSPHDVRREIRPTAL